MNFRSGAASWWKHVEKRSRDMFDTPNHQIRSLLAAFEASVGASFRSIAGVATPSVPSGRDHRNAKGHTSEVPFVQDAKGQQVDRSSSKLHFIKIKGDAIYIYR